MQPVFKNYNTNPENLNGELSLILMVNEINFFKNIKLFLHELSQHLHASIRISFNSNNQLKIYKWRNTTDKNLELLYPPKEFKIENTYVIFEGEKEFNSKFSMYFIYNI